jgi:hypothetical protein
MATFPKDSGRVDATWFSSFCLPAKLQRKLFSCELGKMNFKLHRELSNLKSF